MNNKKLVLKGRALFGGESINVRAIAMRARISRSTVYKLLDEPEKVNITVAMLYRYLTRGLGLSDEQALETKLGEIFEIQEE